MRYVSPKHIYTTPSKAGTTRHGALGKETHQRPYLLLLLKMGPGQWQMSAPVAEISGQTGGYPPRGRGRWPETAMRRSLPLWPGRDVLAGMSAGQHYRSHRQALSQARAGLEPRGVSGAGGAQPCHPSPEHKRHV